MATLFAKVLAEGIAGPDHAVSDPPPVAMGDHERGSAFVGVCDVPHFRRIGCAPGRCAPDPSYCCGILPHTADPSWYRECHDAIEDSVPPAALEDVRGNAATAMAPSAVSAATMASVRVRRLKLLGAAPVSGVSPWGDEVGGGMVMVPKIRLKSRRAAA